ncbi:cytochrome-c peroxidase [Solemya velum gill symbiont]|uniref:cytochrome-c peroxidase n=1 Tax=Solemya velum gill symbiont TaxID=2340 RepID=UPI000997C71F|nr:cytochrome c peroxidase [Solemya velum gill symbiont]OOZ16880.1 cytochrome-c peroxidase [Solemya velum gill symbiont]OOZ26320.1 cytochrome-c peroxidase [Solemya velum gill symbiont]
MKKLAFLALALPLTATAVEFVDNSTPDIAKVELGKLLFHDKILSGNKNISCATCHHALADTGDGLSLPIGEGGVGLGVTRDTGTGADAVHERVPRNAPPVFMLGSTEVTRIFHDGRIEVDPTYPSGFKSPAGGDLPNNLENIVAVQAMFPVTSSAEMAGQSGENPVADATSVGNLAGPGGVWELLADRLRAIPEYEARFNAVFGISAADITYAHAANAIAAFEIDAWRADNSPWDAYKAGNYQAFSKDEQKGKKLFFGKAGCSECHSGEIFSDMEFHAIAMPQIGPGKGHGIGDIDGNGVGREDFGRGGETGVQNDMYAFRTPILRNVALTAPYGHAGAYDTLEEVVRHHLDPVASLWAYDCHSQPVMPSRADLDAIDCVVMDSSELVQKIADAASDYEPVSLSDKQVDRLVAFLHTLTDKGNIDLRSDVPRSVPSGLTLAE